MPSPRKVGYVGVRFQREWSNCMLKNEYISRSGHKAFLEKTTGCAEDYADMGEVIRDDREMILACLDLASAYGSVRNSLIFLS